MPSAFNPNVRAKLRIGGSSCYVDVTLATDGSGIYTPVDRSDDPNGILPKGTARCTTGVYLSQFDREGALYDPQVEVTEDDAQTSPAVPDYTITKQAGEVRGNLLYNDSTVVDGYLDAPGSYDGIVRMSGGESTLPKHNLCIINYNRIKGKQHIVKVRIYRKGVFVPTPERFGSDAEFETREMIFRLIAAPDPDDENGCDFPAGQSLTIKYNLNLITGVRSA